MQPSRARLLSVPALFFFVVNAIPEPELPFVIVCEEHHDVYPFWKQAFSGRAKNWTAMVSAAPAASEGVDERAGGSLTPPAPQGLHRIVHLDAHCDLTHIGVSGIGKRVTENDAFPLQAVLDGHVRSYIWISPTWNSYRSGKCGSSLSRHPASSVHVDEDLNINVYRGSRTPRKAHDHEQCSRSMGPVWGGAAAATSGTERLVRGVKDFPTSRTNCSASAQNCSERTDNTLSSSWRGFSMKNRTNWTAQIDLYDVFVLSTLRGRLMLFLRGLRKWMMDYWWGRMAESEDLCVCERGWHEPISISARRVFGAAGAASSSVRVTVARAARSPQCFRTNTETIGIVGGYERCVEMLGRYMRAVRIQEEDLAEDLDAVERVMVDLSGDRDSGDFATSRITDLYLKLLEDPFSVFTRDFGRKDEEFNPPKSSSIGLGVASAQNPFAPLNISSPQNILDVDLDFVAALNLKGSERRAPGTRGVHVGSSARPPHDLPAQPAPRSLRLPLLQSWLRGKVMWWASRLLLPLRNQEETLWSYQERARRGIAVLRRGFVAAGGRKKWCNRWIVQEQRGREEWWSPRSSGHKFFMLSQNNDGNGTLFRALFCRRLFLSSTPRADRRRNLLTIVEALSKRREDSHFLWFCPRPQPDPPEDDPEENDYEKKDQEGGDESPPRPQPDPPDDPEEKNDDSKENEDQEGGDESPPRPQPDPPEENHAEENEDQEEDGPRFPILSARSTDLIGPTITAAERTGVRSASTRPLMSICVFEGSTDVGQGPSKWQSKNARESAQEFGLVLQKLLQKGLRPSLVTVARSTLDGYLPLGRLPGAEAEVMKALVVEASGGGGQFGGVGQGFEEEQRKNLIKKIHYDENLLHDYRWVRL